MNASSAPLPWSSLGPGTLVEHYRITRSIGRGGMGEVYLARDTKLGRRVALKVIHADILSSGAIQRFLFEAQTTARFAHPHIVTVYGVGEFEGSPFVALEYLEGQSLRQRLEEGPLGVKEILRLGLAIAEALSEAHAHEVLHRDLKPENIMIPKDGRLRVVDFGLAKSLGGPSMPCSTRPGQDISHSETMLRGPKSQAEVVGTPAYMAPEQWGDGECSTATDLWAFGLILYELVCGRHPYNLNSILTICAQVTSESPVPGLAPRVAVPPELESLINACLSKSPQARPEAAEIAATLRALLHQDRVQLEAEECPYRGLAPFSERHAGFFFGREAEVAAFLERLRVSPTLAVVGPSGAGKSSFVLSGVIPSLRERGAWRVLVVRPGRHPINSLASRLVRGEESGSQGSAASGGTDPRASEEDQQSEIESVAESLRLSPGTLGMRLQHLAEECKHRVLLVVDQLEEAYTNEENSSERSAFLEAICSAADDERGPVRVVVTLRDDFLARVAETQAARNALASVTILRTPGPESLTEVLRNPARVVGYDFEDPGIVQELLAAVREEPSALSLLQVVCQALWERRDRARKLLTREAFDRLGGVAGTLARQADAILEGLTPSQIDLAREILLRTITPQRTRRVVTRAQALDGLGTDAPSVLDRLIGERALTVRRGREGADEAEIAIIHESLIRSWSRLKRWLDESQEDVTFLAEVQQAAELWAKRNRTAEEVWRGPALVEALHRRSRLRSAPALVDEFLAAGQRLAQRTVFRRRLAIGSAMTSLAAVAAVLAFQVREVRKQQAVAEDRRVVAERQKAETLREAAKSALLRGNNLEARAKLRLAFEATDSTPARALWWRLSRVSELWHQETSVTTDLTPVPGGELVAIPTGGPVSFLDTQTGEIRTSLQSDKMWFASDFTPDGRTMVATGSEVSLWDVPTATRRTVLGVPSNASRLVRVSPDGRLAAAQFGENSVRVWDLQSAKPVHDAALSATSLRFVRSGKELLVAGADGVLTILDTATWATVDRVPPRSPPLFDVACDASGTRLFLAENDGAVRVWNRPKRTEDRVLKVHEGPATSLAIHPDSTRLATGGQDGRVVLTSVDADRPSEVVWQGTGRARVAFDASGKTLYAGYRSGMTYAWDLSAEADLRKPLGPDSIWMVATVSPKGDVVVSGSTSEPGLWLWDGPSAKLLSRVQEVPGPAQALAYHPLRPEFAAGFPDGSVRLGAVPSGNFGSAFRGHSGPVTKLAFSPDGTLLASGSADDSVVLWDYPSGQLRQRLVGHTNDISSLAFRGDSQELASASADGSIRLWNVTRGGAGRTLHQGAIRSVGAVAYDPTGRTLAAGVDRAVRLWDLASATSRVLFTPTAIFPVTIPQLEYPPSGRLLGVGQGEGLPKLLLDATTGKEQFAFPNTVGPSSVFDISAEGSSLITDEGAAARLWDTSTGRPRWFGSFILPDPPRPPLSFTHRGWQQFGSDRAAVVPATGRWREAIETRTRVGATDNEGKLLCLLTYDDKLELWDRARDELLRTVSVPGASDVAVFSRGCALLTVNPSTMASAVVFHSAEGRSLPLLAEALAFTVEDDRVLTASEKLLLALDKDGNQLWSRPAPSGITYGIAVVEGGFALGRFDGNIDFLPADASLKSRPLLDTPRAPVARLQAGPRGTLLGSYANGFVGLWHLETGELLDHIKLHGRPVLQAVFQGDLYLVTNVGDREVLPLAVFQQDYCQVLRSVWDRVLVVWENGRAVRRAPASDHACARRL